MVELEVRELLIKYEFPGDDIPIIKGSALEGDGVLTSTNPMRTIQVHTGS